MLQDSHRISTPALVIALLLAAVALAFTAIRASLFPSDDAAAFQYIGSAITHGSRLYVDVWDNKLPSIYYLFSIYDFFSPGNIYLHSFFNMGISIANAIAFWLILTELRIKNQIAVTLFYFFITSMPQYSFATTEYPASLLINCAIVAILREKKLLSATLLVLATSFWIPTAFVAIGIFISPLTKKNMPFIAAYFLIGVLATVAFFGFLGYGSIQVLLISWQKYIQTGSSATTLKQTIHGIFDGLIDSGLLFTIVPAALLVTRSQAKEHMSVLIWLFATLLGTLPSHRFYPHYFIPSFAPALILTADAIHRMRAELISHKRIRAAMAILLSSLLVYPLVKQIRHTYTYEHDRAKETLEVSQLVLAHWGKGLRLDIYGHYSPQMFLATGAILTKPDGLVSQALIDPKIVEHQHIALPLNQQADALLIYGNTTINKTAQQQYSIYDKLGKWTIYQRVSAH